MPPLYLTAHHAFFVPAGGDVRPALKAHGIDGRRMTRFSQLALLGAAPLQGEHLYLASSFHSPGTFLRTFDNLLAHNLPSPLDFIANLHNAAAFQVARQLDIGGTSLFMAVDGETLWQPLWLAVNECLAHPQDRVLVGWAWEAPPGSDARQEGSVWWRISARAEGAVARMAVEAASVAAHAAPADGAAMLQTVVDVYGQLQGRADVLLPACGAPGFALQLRGM